MFAYFWSISKYITFNLLSNYGMQFSTFNCKTPTRNRALKYLKQSTTPTEILILTPKFPLWALKPFILTTFHAFLKLLPLLFPHISKYPQTFTISHKILIPRLGLCGVAQGSVQNYQLTLDWPSQLLEFTQLGWMGGSMCLIGGVHGNYHWVGALLWWR